MTADSQDNFEYVPAAGTLIRALHAAPPKDV